MKSHLLRWGTLCIPSAEWSAKDRPDSLYDPFDPDFGGVSAWLGPGDIFGDLMGWKPKRSSELSRMRDRNGWKQLPRGAIGWAKVAVGATIATISKADMLTCEDKKERVQRIGKKNIVPDFLGSVV